MSIFISYRRGDSRHITDHIYDRLVTAFGKAAIFKDVDSIPLGSDFRTVLEEAVSRSHILLAVIGSQWISIPGNDGRPRIQDPNDFVRIEIETALKRGIPIVPVMVDGASIPGMNELPPSLREIAFRHGTVVRPDPDFHRDVDRLIKACQSHGSGAKDAATRGTANELTRGPAPIIRMHSFDVTQQVIAETLAGRLGLNPSSVGFKFAETTGDLIPEDCYLELKNGTRVSFSRDDLDEAINDICLNLATSLLREGFIMSSCVVKGSKAKTYRAEGLDPSARLSILLEKQAREFADCSHEELSRALESYAFALPSHHNRSSLNALPRPSPVWGVLEELVKREAWKPLVPSLGSVASVEPDIAVLWIAEIVKKANSIQAPQILVDLERTKPSRPDAVRTWAEQLANLWFGVVEPPAG
jgi:hypothetical protein